MNNITERTLYHCTLITFLLLSQLSKAHDLVINELMRSNVDAVYCDGQFPEGWAELYNSSDVNSHSLIGYRIGDSKDFNRAFVLPDTTIHPKQHLLIYFDEVDSLMHANYKLDTGKDFSLYLFSPQGIVVDRVDIAKKSPAPNISYSRESDGSDKWGYALYSTPGIENISPVVDINHILSPVVFTPGGSVMEQGQSLDVSLSVSDGTPEDATIIYTTDGSEPSDTNGKIYAMPFTIYDNTIIRAKVISGGYVSIPSNANSYIFMDHPQSTAVISIVTDDRYLYDDDLGILCDGPSTNEQPNWSYNRWRPLNMEYFEPADGQVINQLCLVRVHGQFTRQFPLKSMQLKANKRMGTKRFYHTFWPKDKPNVSEPQRIVLRNGGNDFARTYLNDGVTQRVVGRNSDDLDWQAYTPAVVFINGRYHAMMAVRECANEDYIASNYNGLEDIEMIENWWTIKVGDESARDEFRSFVVQPHTYEDWCSYIDIDSYLTYWALKYWTYECDFPINNIVMWRRVDTDKKSPWRWLVKDCDAGMGYPYVFNCQDSYYSYIQRNKTSYNIGFKMFFNAMQCPEIHERFINHIIAHCGDYLNADTFVDYLDEIIDDTHGELAISDSKWRLSREIGCLHNLDEALSLQRNWIINRQKYIYDIIREDFALGMQVPVVINEDSDLDQLDRPIIRYNDIKLSKGKFDGFDFAGRTLNIEVDTDLPVFWEVAINGEPAEYAGKSLQLNLNEDSSYNINLRYSSSVNDIDYTGIKIDKHGAMYRISSSDKLESIKIYDIAGRLIKHIDMDNTHAYHTEFGIQDRGVYIVEVKNCHNHSMIEKLTIR